MKNVIATYHKDCIDGTTAAAVVQRVFPDAKLFPMSHAYTAEDMQAVLDEVDDETEAYTVDCGIGARELLERGVSVTTIDHHIGAKELFESLAKKNSNFTYIINNEKSGASLAWSYFFTGETEPELIKYVEDADLWRWKYGGDTKDVNNYLSMFRNDPKAMLGILEGDLNDVKTKGNIISMYADEEIKHQVELPSIEMKIGKYVVPAFNITVYESASGNILAESLGKTVAMFTIKGDMVKLSFRSKENQNPSSLELAHILEGGGHVLAAGADVPLQTFLKMLV